MKSEGQQIASVVPRRRRDIGYTHIQAMREYKVSITHIQVETISLDRARTFRSL